MASCDNGRPLPKFGEWDVNDPSSAEGFTVIFNKARDDKKTGQSASGNNRNDSRGRDVGQDKNKQQHASSVVYIN